MQARATLAVVFALFTVAPLPAKAEDAFEPLNKRIEAVLQKWQVPGATVAIALKGRLLYARGFGFADVEAAQAIQPDSLARIASLSKVMTAVGILRLVDEGELDLDSKAFDLLESTAPLPSGADQRLRTITVRQLLHHTSGWANKLGADPFLRNGNLKIAKALGMAAPVNCTDVIRFVASQPLDYEPGTQFSYTNLNYCILGKIIERASGMSYASYMQKRVLKPSGIRRAVLGRSLLRDAAPGEVKYYGPLALTPSALGDTKTEVEWPYGGFNLEAMDAFGGWVMSAVDVLRFMGAVEGYGQPALLTPNARSLLEERPSPPVSMNDAFYYGLGFLIRPLPAGGANWWHYGYLPGSISYVVRSPNGFSAAVITNGGGQTDSESAQTGRDLEQALLQGASEVKQWPSVDLFGTFR
jgi:CubicO group peptidase (beta-lactamase class C family)